jgi:hypothetical protein
MKLSEQYCPRDQRRFSRGIEKVSIPGMINSAQTLTSYEITKVTALKAATQALQGLKGEI